MRIKILLFATSIIFISTFQLKAQQVFKTTSGSVIGYLEYLPADYQNNSDKYPVVFFLHGIGERGVNSTDPAVLSTTISRVSKLGPPMYAKNGTQFPFILISPQLKENYSNWPTSYVMEVINYCKTYLRIDEKRIYITGLSLGGGGVWWAAQGFPELFAAIAPVCGGYNTLSQACKIAGENLPVWAFHGDADSVVPLSRTVNMVNAINNCTPAPNPLAKVTIYPGVGHDAWKNAYRTDHLVHNPNVYEWMLSYTNTTNFGNKIPFANAGADLSIAGSTGKITGSGTDADGTIASYDWKQMSGPSAATLVNYNTSTVSLSGLVPGKYYFKLTVKDNTGNADTDYVTVNVTAANALPVVYVGTDKTIYLPVNTVTITGTASDSDGTIVKYAWTKVSGPEALLTGVATTVLTASGLVQGSYVFQLTVTDNLGGVKSDKMALYVKSTTTTTTPPSTTNTAPTVNAGANIIVTYPASAVNITAIGTDAENNIVKYQWVKTSGPVCTMSNAGTSTLNLTGLAAGRYVFSVTVTDAGGLTASDQMALNVNLPPVVDAGADKIVTLPASSVVLNGTATDSDGTIRAYQWTKESGPAATLTNSTTASLTASGLTAGTYVFKFKAVDNLNASSYDVVQVVVQSSSTASTSTASSEMTSKSNTSSRTNQSAEQEMAEDNGNTASTDFFTGLNNANVIIYNTAGNKIFSGLWSADRYHEVFKKAGMYIYNIMRDGRPVETGKVLIAQQ